jgi:peptidoglycan/LPS O-acetylase OafA/YrhL
LKKLPNIDPLRFVLASLVLIFHLPQLFRNQGLAFYDDMPIFHRGIQAVYMFFVLSGFLIIRIIYKEKKQGHFSIKKFYMRRVLRILPLYYFIVFFGLTFYNVVLPYLNIPFENNYNLKTGLIYNIFFIPNIFAKLFRPGSILEVLWSIGIEEQFYLFIAPLLFLIKKQRLLLFLVLLTLTYFVIFHLKAFLILPYYKMVYFFLFAGGITAILEEKNKLKFLKKSIIFPLIITTCTTLFFITDWIYLNPLWLQNLLICILFSLFIHTLAHNNCGIIIKNKFINYCGSISYGIYMFHAIGLYFVAFLFLKIEYFNNLDDVVVIILSNFLTFAITILVAHISYKYFENYFLKLKDKFR